MSNEKKTDTSQPPPISAPMMAYPAYPPHSMNPAHTMGPYQHPASFDPHNIMNAALTGMISEQFFSVLKSQEGSTLQKIVKILAVTSIYEVKTHVMTCIKKLFTLFGENYVLIFRHIDKYIIRNIFVTTIYKLFVRLKKKLFPAPKLICDSISNIQDALEISPTKNINVKIKLEQSFMASLFNYINSNKSTVDYSTINQKVFLLLNNQKFIVGEIWSNIMIEFESIFIRFNTPIKFSYADTNGKLIFESYELYDRSGTKIDVEKLTKEECDNIRTISDLIQDPEDRKSFREEVLKYVPRAYEKSVVKSNGSFSSIAVTFNYVSSGCGKTEDGLIGLNLIEYFQSKFTNLNAVSTLWELDYIFRGQNMVFEEMIKSTSATSFELFNCTFQFEKLKILSKNTTPITDVISGCGVFDVKPSRTDAFRKGFLNGLEYFAFCDGGEHKTKYNTYIPVNISSNTLDKDQINKIFTKFISHINTFIENKQVKEPVKSFIIKIEREEKIELIPNPEYANYQRKKKEIELLLESENAVDESDLMTAGASSGSSSSSSTKSSKSSKSSKSKKGSDMKNILTTSLVRLLSDVPPEKIEKVNVESKIKLTEVNEIYKSFENLYLRKEDKTKLKNLLEMFYDNKELMIDYGIPHKLGILLHGIPGTGKTTTIQAIATWLKKNIYCVDLKSIKTNKDFFLTVENICKHCANGGILVLEDFDAMGKVMHRRTDTTTTSETLVDLMEQENCELTLDYILNILQGSLTPSGFVFILTTNHIEKIDEAVYRDGRIDIKIDMKLCNHYQIQSIYKKFIKREIPEHILKNICENKWTPANVIYKLVHHIKSIDTDEEILEPFIECTL
jgi:ATP-dependent 26S proteasome regulatory subunit